jgi:hypothetical protein
MKSAERSVGSNKFRGDKDFRQLAAEFFAAAEVARCASPEDVAAIERAGGHCHMVMNVRFACRPETDTALTELVKRCSRLAGKNVADEGDIWSIAWHCAADSAPDIAARVPDIAARVNALADALGAATSSASTYIAPNYLVALTGGIRRFSIGPVEARFTEDVAPEIAEATQDKHWRIVLGRPTRVESVDGKLIATFPHSCWKVNVAASRTNLPTEAIWLINVAVSLLRLSLPRPLPFMSTLTPDIGDVEPHPTRHSEINEAELSLAGKRVEVSGPPELRHYWVDQQLIEHLNNNGFAERAAVLFDRPRGTVAERLAQGLGWMSRGRQARDRAERMLFFFTAIETLLSSGDKNSPVVDRIARDAATIVAPEPGDRHDIAREITKLYGTRSELVHGGHRNTSASDANNVQAIAETLYISVLENMDLRTKVDAFRGALTKAGFGTPWQPQPAVYSDLTAEN